MVNEITPASLGCPLSLFNKNSTLKMIGTKIQNRTEEQNMSRSMLGPKDRAHRHESIPGTHCRTYENMSLLYMYIQHMYLEIHAMYMCIAYTVLIYIYTRTCMYIHIQML